MSRFRHPVLILALLAGAATGCADGTEFGTSSPRHGLELSDKTRVAAQAAPEGADLYWLKNGSAIWYVQTNNVDDLRAKAVPTTMWSAIGQTASPPSGAFGVPVIVVTYLSPAEVGQWHGQFQGASLFTTVHRPGGETVEVWTGAAADKYAHGVLLAEILRQLDGVPLDNS